jgi:hypothetical protein
MSYYKQIVTKYFISGTWNALFCFAKSVCSESSCFWLLLLTIVAYLYCLLVIFIVLGAVECLLILLTVIGLVCCLLIPG